MDSFERFNEIKLPTKKKEFYSNLHIEDTTDEDYEACKKVWKVFWVIFCPFTHLKT